MENRLLLLPDGESADWVGFSVSTHKVSRQLPKICFSVDAVVVGGCS
jgi:hypothetical protein